jgi:hypothetical protein
MGRAALVVLGLILAVLGLGLGYATLKTGAQVIDAGADRAGQFSAPMLLLAAFVTLVGITFMVLAFAPGREADRAQTPTYWSAISALFDGFWGLVREWLRRP